MMALQPKVRCSRPTLMIGLIVKSLQSEKSREPVYSQALNQDITTIQYVSEQQPEQRHAEGYTSRKDTS